MKVGILGGTFDPIHFGHLILAQEAYEQYGLDLIAFIPTFDPHYRSVKTPYEDRYIMCRNATDPDPRFATKDVRERYMVDTLENFHTVAEKYLIIGGDQASKFWSWKAPSLVVNKVRGIICATRSLYGQGRILDHWGEHSHLLNWLEMPTIEVSASAIRQKRQEGDSIQYLVPPAVEEYVRSEGLYK